MESLPVEIVVEIAKRGKTAYWCLSESCRCYSSAIRKGISKFEALRRYTKKKVKNYENDKYRTIETSYILPNKEINGIFRRIRTRKSDGVAVRETEILYLSGDTLYERFLENGDNTYRTGNWTLDGHSRRLRDDENDICWKEDEIFRRIGDVSFHERPVMDGYMFYIYGFDDNNGKSWKKKIKIGASKIFASEEELLGWLVNFEFFCRTNASQGVAPVFGSVS